MKKTISKQTKLKKYLELPLKLLSDGEKMEESKLLIRQEVVGTIVPMELYPKIQINQPNNISFMQEYPQEDNSPILIDNANISDLSTLKTNIFSSETLGVVSTSKEKDLKPFWNAQIKKQSEKSWLPIKTDSPDLDSNYWNVLSPKQGENSWFSITQTVPLNKNSQTISLPSSLHSQHAHMDLENTRYKSKKILIFPSVNQHLILQNWMAMYRWIYNRTVEIVNDRLNKKIKSAFDFKIVRDKCVRPTFKYHLHQYPDWYTGNKIPSRVLDGAIRTCCQNFKANISKLKEGSITHFNMRLKSKLNATSIVIANDCFSSKKNGFHIDVLGEIQSSEIFYTYPHHASFLKYEPKTNVYTLYLPILDFQVPYTKVNKEIGIDLGEKNVAVGYSPNQEIVKVGVMCRYRLKRIDKKIENLTSKISKMKNNKNKKRIKKLKTRRTQLYQRKKNLRDDLHWKTISFLTKNYDTIIVGDLSVQSIVQKLRDKRVKNTFHGLSLYMFKERLEWKCKMTGRIFIYQDESYTTQTCTQCGSLSKPQDRVYQCNHCKLVIHRDINAARNIWLRGHCDAEKRYKAKLKRLKGEYAKRSEHIVHHVQSTPMKKLFSKPQLRRCQSFNDFGC